MKLSYLALLAGFLMVTPLAAAGSESTFQETQRIVVISNGEGIHYARGCRFYTLRDLIADSAANLADASRPPGNALFEFRLLGIEGVTTMYLGDHWISGDAESAKLTDSVFKQLLEMIDARKGQGAPERSIEVSIRSALAEIQSLTYKEDNRCSRR